MVSDIGKDSSSGSQGWMNYMLYVWPQDVAATQELEVVVNLWPSFIV